MKSHEPIESIIALSNASIKSAANIHIIYSSPQGHKLQITIDQPKAKTVQRNAARTRKTLKNRRRVMLMPPATEARLLDQELIGLSKALIEAQKTGASGQASANTIWSLLKPIVEGVRQSADGEATLKRIARSLRSQGQEHAARYFD